VQTPYKTHMKKLLFLFLLAVFILSCEKENSVDSNGVNSPDGSPQLSKVITTYLPDNFDYYIREFEYDANDLVYQIKSTFKIKRTNGTIDVIQGTTQFFRDNLQRIIRIGSSPDTSSINTIIHYVDPSSKKVASAVIIKNIGFSSVILDSTVFEYGNNGKISKSSHYIPNANNIPKLSTYQVYGYDLNGNVISKALYQDDDANGSFEVALTYQWEYDDKLNPMFQDEIAYFQWSELWPDYSSKNNVTKQVNVYAATASDQLQYSYQYDQLLRPSLQLQIGYPENKTTYYYQ
jgi:hypothetical protein